MTDTYDQQQEYAMQENMLQTTNMTGIFFSVITNIKMKQMILKTKPIIQIMIVCLVRV